MYYSCKPKVEINFMDYLSPAFSKHGLFLAEPRTIWHGPNMLMDVLDRTKFQVPLAIDQSFHGFFGQDEHQRPFGMDQMSQRTFWRDQMFTDSVRQVPNLC